MARHIMAVCVVCLLCADHLPCQQHVETLFPAQTEYTQLNAVVYNTNELSSSLSPKPQSTETTVAYATSSSDNRRRRRRTKRHSNGHGGGDHGSDLHTRPEITEAFLKRIFNEFGSVNDTIHVEDFQRMLHKLGLHELLPQQLHRHNNINDYEVVSATILLLCIYIYKTNVWLSIDIDCPSY